MDDDDLDIELPTDDERNMGPKGARVRRSLLGGFVAMIIVVAILSVALLAATAGFHTIAEILGRNM